MKMLLTILLWINVGGQVFAQGIFCARGLGRIGTLDGPPAGSDHLGQFLAGNTLDALVPVGVPIEFVSINGVPQGFLPGVRVPVPFAPFASEPFVQMVAWDR